MQRITPPLTGTWTFLDDPPLVTIQGVPFRKAVWSWEFYPNVRVQYREDVPQHSKHLFVRHDNTWFIDHTDAFNPDFGPKSLLLHGIVDILGRGLSHG